MTQRAFLSREFFRRTPPLLFLLLAGAFQSPSAETPSRSERYALVIGNASYQTPLPALTNSVHDAQDIAARFDSLGFHVLPILDADRTRMTAAIDSVANLARRDGALLVFYYAGHAMQVDGDNYLVPVGAKMPETPAQLESRFLRLTSGVMNLLEEANTPATLVILDACRTPPPAFSGSRGIRPQAGLSAIEPGNGTLLAFSTSPNAPARDAVAPGGRNGLYTHFLLQHLGAAGADMSSIFNLVRAATLEASKGEQRPWELSSLTSNLFLRPEEGRSELARLAEFRRNPELLKLELGKDALRSGDLWRFERFDDVRARAAYDSAARLLNPLAKARLAEMDAQGLGGAWDSARARVYAADARETLRGLADSGHAIAAYALARLLWQGLGGPTDKKRAIVLAGAAATKGHLAARASFLEWSVTLPDSDSASARLHFDELAALAASGTKEAWLPAFRASRMRNATERFRGYLDSALRSGDGDALRTRCRDLSSQSWKRDILDSLAQRACRQAAVRGQREAMSQLGDWYRWGGYLLSPDSAEAYAWYSRAAILGDARALSQLHQLGGDRLPTDPRYDLADLRFRRADSLFREGLYRQLFSGYSALALYDSALVWNPHLSRAAIHRLAWASDSARIRDSWRDIQVDFPREPSFHAALATRRSALSLTDADALEHISYAIKREPSRTGFAQEQGRLLLKSGSVDSALRVYDRLARQRVVEPSWQWDFCTTLRDTPGVRRQQKIEAFRKLFQRDPQGPWATVTSEEIASLYYDDQRPDSARRWSVDPVNGSFYALQDTTLEADSAAADLIKLAERIEPGWPRAAWRRAQWHLRAGGNLDSAEAYLHVAAKGPDSAYSLGPCLQALAHHQRGLQKEAHEALAACIKIRGGWEAENVRRRVGRTEDRP